MNIILVFAIIGLTLILNETGLDGDIDLTVQKQECCVHISVAHISFPRHTKGWDVS